MNLLRIQLLGQFCVSCNGQVLTGVDTPRLQSLLAYLILHRNLPQSRRYLAFLLWPDSPETQVSTNLRNLLYLLRHSLPDADAYLEVTNHALQWRPQAPAIVDVFEFERAMAEAGSHQEWLRVVELYQGDLLPNCYDDWVVPERERFRRDFASALQQLISLLEQQGDYHSALGYVRRLLRTDPLKEEVYRLLMRLSALSGDHAQVVWAYNTCTSVLQRELGIETSAETREAYARYSELAASLSYSLEESPSPRVVPGVPNIRGVPGVGEPPTQGSRLNNLPPQLNRLVGREQERVEVKGLIAANRLVILTGAGGVGKSRLAFAAAEDLAGSFSDGVWLVDLAPLSDPRLVLQSVGSILGVREMPARPLTDLVVDFLHDRNVLLVLDNCEHQVNEVGVLAKTLLGGAPDLRILATSREAFKFAGEGEVAWQVPPLSVPPVSEASALITRNLASLLPRYESVQLFVERAVSAFPTFQLTRANASALASICRVLDGLPLAIELAAAQTRLLTAPQIAERLGDAFHVLTHGSSVAVPHHRTLRATMDWSYQTLAEKERILFRRLSGFAGSFTLQAVEAVCSDCPATGCPTSSLASRKGDLGEAAAIARNEVLELVAGLIDKSLVTPQTRRGEPKLRLLETVRQYAREKLKESGEAEAVHKQHALFFMALAKEMEPRLTGDKQGEWLDRLEDEHDNMRAALGWARESQELQAGEIGLRLATAMGHFWEARGYFSEGRTWLEALLHRAGALAPTSLRAKALYVAGLLAFQGQGDAVSGRSFLEQALALCRETGDKPMTGQVLQRLGLLAASHEDHPAARPLLEESLAIFRELGDRRAIALGLLTLGTTAFRLSDYEAGRTLLEESLAIYREIGWDFWSGLAAELRGHIARHEGDYKLAGVLYRESMEAATGMGAQWAIPYGLNSFGCLAAAEGEYERAARLFGATQSLRESIGMPLVPIERAELEEGLAITRAHINEQAFVAAYSEGARMKIEVALAYALQDQQSRETKAEL